MPCVIIMKRALPILCLLALSGIVRADPGDSYALSCQRFGSPYNVLRISYKSWVKSHGLFRAPAEPPTQPSVEDEPQPQPSSPPTNPPIEEQA
jgi:hypothetical protein